MMGNSLGLVGGEKDEGDPLLVVSVERERREDEQ
jgi:hypothetical protein